MMNDFEKKLCSGAAQLEEQLRHTGHFLSLVEKGQPNINVLPGEVELIKMNYHAMQISYECLMKRITMRNLVQEYSDCCVSRDRDEREIF